MPAEANAAAAASIDGLVRTPGDSHGENTSNEPGRRPRNSTDANFTGFSHRSKARAPRARMSATPPASGAQNMYRVSGSLMGSDCMASSTDTGVRRQAFGCASPYAKAFWDTNPSVRSLTPFSCR